MQPYARIIIITIIIFTDIKIKTGTLTIQPSGVVEIYQDTSIPVDFTLSITFAGEFYNLICEATIYGILW